MKKPASPKQSDLVEDSLKAIPSIKSHGAIRQGLANIMLALRDGSISVEESEVLRKATKRQVAKLKRGG